MNQEKSDVPLLLDLRDATVMKQNRKHVLDGVNLTIKEGDHTAILGPNGSGKSSLIKLITRQHYALVHPDGSPSMLIYGRERWNVFELRALLGIVSPDLQQMFSSGFTHGKIRGLDVVLSGFFASSAIYPQQHEVTTAMRRKGLTALVHMEAEHLVQKPLDEMSTGEARRLLIARALVHDPRALVLDEPTVGLDLLAAQRFLGTLRGIAQRGKTIMLVTHHIDEVLPEIERVILLKQGRVFLDGPKREVLTTQHLSALYDAPIHIHTGSAGFYTATVDEHPRAEAPESTSLRPRGRRERRLSAETSSHLPDQ